MKKFIAFALCFAMLLSWAACSPAAPATSESASKPAATEPTKAPETEGKTDDKAPAAEIEAITLKAGCTNSLGSAAYTDME